MALCGSLPPPKDPGCLLPQPTQPLGTVDGGVPGPLKPPPALRPPGQTLTMPIPGWAAGSAGLPEPRTSATRALHRGQICLSPAAPAMGPSIAPWGGGWEWECSPVRPLFGTERPQEGEMVQKSCLGRVRNRFPGTCLGLSVHIMGFPEESDGLQALEGVLPSPRPQHWLASVCDTGLYSALCFVSRLVHLGPLKPEDSGACRSSCQLPHITAQLLLPHPASAGQAAHCSCGW